MIKAIAVILGFSIFGFCIYQGEKKIRVNGEKINEEIDKLLGEDKDK